MLVHVIYVYLDKKNIINSIIMYLTYDVDQSTVNVYIYGIVLWLGKYHDIALWYNKRLVGYKPVNTLQAGQFGV